MKDDNHSVNLLEVIHEGRRFCFLQAPLIRVFLYSISAFFSIVLTSFSAQAYVFDQPQVAGTYSNSGATNATWTYRVNHLESVDFDKDGDLDVLYVLQFSSSDENDNGRSLIEWRENDSSNSFSTKHTITLSSRYAIPTGVTAIDYDDDGFTDIFARVYDPALPACCRYTYVKYRNDHNGGFENGITVHTADHPSTSFKDPVAIDVDGDGDHDIVVGGDTGGWFENLNDNTFSLHTHPSFVGINPTRSLDLDNDSKNDLIGISYGGLENSYLQFVRIAGSSFSTSSSPIANRGPRVYFDWDSDGFLDIVKTEGWYRNQGNGAFSSPMPINNFDIDGNDGELFKLQAVADFDRDGVIDLGYTYQNFNEAQGGFFYGDQFIASPSEKIFWFEGDQSGGYYDEQFVGGERTQVSQHQADVLFLDYDSDGDQDAIGIIDTNFNNQDAEYTPHEFRVYENISETLTSVDFGDASDIYRTKLRNNGARHRLSSLYLGATIDAEPDAQITANLGLGDDENGQDDENGITFIEPLIYNTTLELSVLVTGSGGYINCWVDFDQNGNFDSSIEHIVDGVSVSEGSQTLSTVVIPPVANANYYETMARCRLSSDPDLEHFGYSSDGEVEDYLISLGADSDNDGTRDVEDNCPNTSNPAQINTDGDSLGDACDSDKDNDTLPNTWEEEHSLNPLDNSDAHSDGDGDFLSALEEYQRGTDPNKADSDDDGVTDKNDCQPLNADVSACECYEESAPLTGFEKTELSTAGNSFRSVAAADFNNDGLSDFVAASRTGDAVLAMISNGSGGFSALTIDSAFDFVFNVVTADFDGDNDIDVAAGGNGTVVWYENNGSASFTKHTIGTTGLGETYLDVADLNVDGHMDIAVATNDDDQAYWYSNNGSGGFTKKTLPVTGQLDSPRDIHATDIDGDGDSDLVIVNGGSGPPPAQPDDSILLLRHTSGDFFQDVVLTTQAEENPWSVTSGDLDGDGDKDLIYAARGGNWIQWLENTGGSSFNPTPHYLLSQGAPWDIRAIDKDNDGDVDLLVGTQSNSKPFFWMENLGGGNLYRRQLDTGFAVYGVEASDHDADGDIDFALVSTDTLARFENQSTACELDFGDAPNSYGTTIAANGANHGQGGPRLGTLRDKETNGNPSALLNGDDNTDTDDEDGVSFIEPLNRGERADVELQISSSTGFARLDAWIDFDANGVFDADEHIGRGQSVVAGSNTVFVDVPMDAVEGDTAARFRVSQLGNLLPVGFATRGEVEDHVVTILPPLPDADGDGTPDADDNCPNQDNFHQFDRDGDGLGDECDEDIDGDGLPNEYESANGLNPYDPNDAAGDPDGDGQTSLEEYQNGTNPQLADSDGDGVIDPDDCAPTDRLLAYCQCNAGGFFEPVFNSSLLVNGFASSPADVDSADMDGDGDQDLLVASLGNSALLLFLRDSNGNYNESLVATDAIGPLAMTAADLNGDGENDLLAASSTDNSIRWYANTSGVFSAATLISGSAGEAADVAAADLDGDGDLDVVSANHGDNTVAWYQNDGLGNFAGQVISNSTMGVYDVHAVDLDADGDVDVLSASVDDDTITWFENLGSGSFTPHVISSSADIARAVMTADLDGDGDLDVLSASYGDNTIAWYENRLTEAQADIGPQQLISNQINGAWSVQAGDIDSDGDMDVVATANLGGATYWFRNDGGGSFVQRTIDQFGNGVYVAHVVDADGDGDLDVFSADPLNGRLNAYTNLLQSCPPFEKGNLLGNANFEEDIVSIGQIPQWTVITGGNWRYRTANPSAQSGGNYLFAGVGSQAVLQQSVDISAIPVGEILTFRGYLSGYSSSDTARVQISYQDGMGAELHSYDSGTVTSTRSWQQITDMHGRPNGATTAVITLTSTRHSGSNNDGYYDNLYLGLDDGDFDGVSAILDNCPGMANPDQQDNDADGIGDVCDTHYEGVDFAAGGLAFADLVVSYEPSSAGLSAGQSNPAAALGAPDSLSVSTGNDGRLVLAFTDNALIASGDANPDLFIFEGGDNENAAVRISTDGENWIGGWTVDGGSGQIDIDSSGEVVANTRYSYVEIFDIPPSSSTGGSEGVDIDAVGAISSTTPADADSDGVSDPIDNCPNEANSNQADEDGNGIGDACDVPPDTDGDGMPDSYEQANGLNLSVDDADGDADGDGVSNIDEFNGGTQAGQVDSDGDGLHDGLDVEPATASNVCVGANATLANLLVRNGTTIQCAASSSVSMQSSVVIEAGATLQLYSPQIVLGVGVFVPLTANIRAVPINAAVP